MNQQMETISLPFYLSHSLSLSNKEMFNLKKDEYTYFLMWRHVSFVPNLFRVFIIKDVIFLSNAFFVSIDGHIHLTLKFIFVVNNFNMLNHPGIFGWKLI